MNNFWACFSHYPPLHLRVQTHVVKTTPIDSPQCESLFQNVKIMTKGWRQTASVWNCDPPISLNGEIARGCFYNILERSLSQILDLGPGYFLSCRNLGGKSSTIIYILGRKNITRTKPI